MIGNDLVRRLPLQYKWGNKCVFFSQIMFGKVNTRSGIAKTLFIFPVCDSGIIAVTDGNSTLHAFFAAAIAYIWSAL